MVDMVDIIEDISFTNLELRINNRLEYCRERGVYEVSNIQYSTYYNAKEKQAYYHAMILYKRKEEQEDKR